MKIIHTADLHLGQVFYNHNRDDEHLDFFEQLCGIISNEQPDALVISGDVYDNIAPSKSSQKILMQGLMKIYRKNPELVTVIVAGNHDSASMLTLKDDLWQLANVHIIGSIIKDDNGLPRPDAHIIDINGKGYVVAVPYVNQRFYPSLPDVAQDDRMRAFHQLLLDRVKEINANGLPVVLTGHLAVNNCDIEGHDESRLKLDYTDIANLGNSDDYDYLALGHIHKPQSVWGMDDHSKARYSGAPVAVSFDEPYEHSVCVVEINGRGGKVQHTKAVINPMKRLVTVPAKDATSADEIVNELTKLDDNGSYVRVKLKVKDVVPLEDKTHIEQCFNGHNNILCEIVPVREVVETEDAAVMVMKSADEIKNLNPVDIAKAHYIRTFGIDMDDKFVSMFNEIVNAVDNN